MDTLNEVFEEIKQLNDEVFRLQAQCQQIRLKYQKDKGISYNELNNQWYDYFQNKGKN